MKLFGTKKKKPTLQETIQGLQHTIKNIDGYEQRLTKQIIQCLNQAKDFAVRDKKKAIYFLKRKKQLEYQLDSIYNKKINLELEIMTLESAQTNNEIIQSMNKSKDYLKQVLNDDQLENTANLMDDIQECNQIQEEMDSILSNPIFSLDDNNIEDELEALYQEEEKIRKEDISLPSVPQKSFTSQKSSNMDIQVDNSMIEEDILLE